MASKFLRELQERQELHIKRLITHLLPVQEGEENFGIAWEFVSGNLNPKFHSYKEPAPKDVERLFEELEARMVQHSQLSKASRLHQLRTQLAGLGLEGAKPDVDACILLMLFNLANRPLDSASPEPQTPAPAAVSADSAAAPALAGTPSRSAAGKGGKVSKVEDEDDEEEGEGEGDSEGWSSSSELSDWEGGAEGAGSPPGAKTTASEPAQGAIAAAAEGAVTQTSIALPPTSGPLVEGRGGDARGLHLRARMPIQPSSAPVPSDLVPTLARARLHLTSYAAPRPEQCLSDGYVVHQAINALLGQPSALFTWRDDPVRTALPAAAGSTAGAAPQAPAPAFKRLQPLPGLYVPYLSPSLLSSLLARVAEAGAQAAWLQHLATASAHQVGSTPVPGVTSSLVMAPCVRAMLQAAGAQLKAIRLPLIQLQQANHDTHVLRAGGSSSAEASTGGAATFGATGAAREAGRAPARLSLLQLSALCQGPMDRVGSLYEAVRTALAAAAEAETAAAAVAADLPPLQQAPLHGSHGGGVGLRSAGGSFGSGLFLAGASAPGSGSNSRRASFEGGSTGGTAGASSTAGAGGSSILAGAPGSGAPPQPQAQPSQQQHSHLPPIPARCLVAANVSTALLDSLHARMEASTLHGGPEGQAKQQQLLHLLLCSLSPMLDGLHSWLYDSREDAFTDDFFVCAGARLSEMDPLFWSHAFHLVPRVQPTGAGGSGAAVGAASIPGGATDPAPSGQGSGSAGAGGQGPAAAATSSTQAAEGLACPQLLRPVVHELFSAGKSLRLLRNSERNVLGTGAAGVLAAAPTSLLLAPAVSGGVWQAAGGCTLQETFLKQLQAFLGQYQRLTPGPGPLTAEGPGAGSVAGAGASSGTSFSDLMAQAGDGLSRLQQWSAGQVPDLAWLPPWTPCFDGAAVQAAGLGIEGGLGEGDMPDGMRTPKTPLEGEAVLGGVGGSPDTASPDVAGADRDTAVASPDARRPANGEAAEGAAQQQEQQLSQAFERVARAMEQQPATHAGATGLSGGAAAGPYPADSALPGAGGFTAVSGAPGAAAAGQGSLGNSDLSALLGHHSHVHTQLGWLLEGPCLEPPPVDLLLDQCLFPILRQRAEDVGQEMLSCLLSDWGLLTELSAVRNLFLLASPPAQSWASRLLHGVLKGRQLDQHHEYELEVALQEEYAGQAGQEEALPAVESISIVLDKERIVEARAKASSRGSGLGVGSGAAELPAGSQAMGLRSVQELEGLTLRYQPTWLMSMIGGHDAITSYNNALVFLLQIQSARMAVEKARVRSWKAWKLHASSKGGMRPVPSAGAAGPSAAAAIMQRHGGMVRSMSAGGSQVQGAAASAFDSRQEDLALQEMTHFVINLHQFLVDRLLHSAWIQLEQNLDNSRTLDDVVRHHQAFLSLLDRQAGKGTGAASGTWKHLVGAITKMLDQIHLFCAAQQLVHGHLPTPSSSATAQGPVAMHHSSSVRSLTQTDGGIASGQRAMQSAADQFRQLHSYLMRFMRSKAIKIGETDALEYLVMRLEFNNFYRAD